MTSQADEATNAYNTAQAEAEELEFAEAQISSMMDYLKGLTGRLESASEECKKLESGIKGAIENAIAAKESSEGALPQAFEAAEGCEMGRDEIKELIFPVGFYHTKAARIRKTNTKEKTKTTAPDPAAFFS